MVAADAPGGDGGGGDVAVDGFEDGVGAFGLDMVGCVGLAGYIAGANAGASNSFEKRPLASCH